MHLTQSQLLVLIFRIAFEAVRTEIVAVEIGGRDLGRGVVAFEDQLVAWQPSGICQTSMYYAQRQVVEAVVDASERQDLEGRQGGKDLDKDLGKSVSQFLFVREAIARLGWATWYLPRLGDLGYLWEPSRNDSNR